VYTPEHGLNYSYKGDWEWFVLDTTTISLR
jgi:hypothetical protein